MGIDVVALTATGIAAAKRAGLTARITVTRPAPPPNPVTGVASGAAMSQTLDAIQAKPRRSAKAKDGGWTTAQTVLYVAAAGLTFSPTTGDLVTFAGRTLRLAATDEDAAAGTVTGWFLHLGEEVNRGR